MQQNQPTLPDPIINSVYVHPTTKKENVHMYASLFSVLPKGHNILRLSSEGNALTLLTPNKETMPYLNREEKRNSSSFIKCARKYIEENTEKCLITPSFDENRTLTKLRFSNKISYPTFADFANEQKIVLNLVQNILPEAKESSEKITLKINFQETDIIEKINKYGGLLNNADFQKQYINKQDIIAFPEVTRIMEVMKTSEDTINCICFADNSCALISKAQLVAAMCYDQRPQQKLSELQRFFLPTPQNPANPKKVEPVRSEEEKNTDTNVHPQPPRLTRTYSIGKW